MGFFRVYLDAVRVNSKMTQQEWADNLKVSKATVVNWENGKGEPSWSHLRKMSELSGIPVDFIFVPEKSD